MCSDSTVGRTAAKFESSSPLIGCALRTHIDTRLVPSGSLNHRERAGQKGYGQVINHAGMEFKSPLAHRSEQPQMPPLVHIGTQGRHSCCMRTVEKLPSGRYKVRFRYGTSAKTGKPKQVSETFDNRRAAEQFAKWVDAVGPQAALDLLYEGEQDQAVPTMSELAADHFMHLSGVTAGTKLSYQRLWNRTWAPLIGTTRAHRLTRDQLALALNDLGARYAKKSLENQRGMLAGVIGRAVDNGWQPKNIVRGLRLPDGQPSRGDDDMRILTPEEFEYVEGEMVEHFRPFIRFLWGMGCRWGEAVALPVGKVRLPNVSFHQALKWSPDNNRVVGATKTSKSRRTIIAPPDIHDELLALTHNRSRDEFVFTAPRGGMILHRTFWSRYWLPAVSGLDQPRPRLHDLRHSHASWLLGNGVPIHVVQARLGHESIQTTVDTYSHLLPDAQLGAANAAALAFRPHLLLSQPPPQVLPLAAPKMLEAHVDDIDTDS